MAGLNRTPHVPRTPFPTGIWPRNFPTGDTLFVEKVSYISFKYEKTMNVQVKVSARLPKDARRDERFNFFF